MRNLKKTWKNKLISLAMILTGYLSTFIDEDATGFVFCLIIAVPLFFAKENYIHSTGTKYYIDENDEIHYIDEE